MVPNEPSTTIQETEVRHGTVRSIWSDLAARFPIVASPEG